MIPKIVDAQRDFSAGELNVDSKRNDDLPLLKAGARQLQNWRIMNSRKPCQRPGRRARYVQTGRVDQVRMDSGHVFDLCFGTDNSVNIRDASGAVVFSDSGAGYTWGANVDPIRWDVYGNTIFVCCQSGTTNMRPQLFTWDGASTWSVAAFAEQTTAGGQKRTIFYRMAAKGITLQPSAVSGNINITFSSAYLVAGMVGTRLRFCNRQLTITSRTSATTGTATVNEPLPPGQILGFGVSVLPSQIFSLGEVVEGTVSGAQGIITNINDGTHQITVQLLSAAAKASSEFNKSSLTLGFQAGESVVGPGGSAAIPSGFPPAVTTPQAVSIWDEEVMNTYRGWPASVTVDQNRLVFCDFPALPALIAWSYLGTPNDFYPEAQTVANAIVEVVPQKARVYNLVNTGSAAGDELAFTDAGVFLIPISQSNPLKPGSVVFLPVTQEAASQVRPAVTPEACFYVNSGKTRIIGILGTGQVTRPYIARDVSEQHYHLFSSPKAVAVASGESTFPERYIYVLNADGSLAVARYEASKDYVGWVPWRSSGTPNWIFALRGASVVTLTTTYGATSVCEQQDDGYYLDGVVPINAVPTAIAPTPGLGPLWWLPSSSVDLMDGVKPLGTYATDASGNIVPNNPGEDLSSATLVAGMPYRMVFEPFLPNQEPGESRQQRLRRRRVSKAMMSVKNSTGFLAEAIAPLHLYRRVPAWNQGDNAEAAPPLREETYQFRPTGRAYDPRMVFTKDVPGPIQIMEFAAEVTV